MLRESFLQHFAGITDRRQEGKISHPLMSVLFIAVASYVAFCDEWELTILWAEKNIDWLKQHVDLPHGIPSEITFYRIFRAIDPKEFERRFIGWASQLAHWHAGQTVPIDGKTLCGAKENPGEKSPFHIVRAWASENNLMLGFVRTEAKSNEITAIPELLKLLSIEGDVVTIDAMGAQTEIAKQIVEGNHADYVLSLKGNQPSMHNDTVLFFTDVDLKRTDSKSIESTADSQKIIREADNDVTVSVPNDTVKAAAERIYQHFASTNTQVLPNNKLPVFAEHDYQFYKTRDLGHGRIENRLFFLVADVSWLNRHNEWSGLKSVGMVITHTVEKKTGNKSIDCRFFISSLDEVYKFAKSVREHWGIEVSHNILDVTFCEDNKRTHKENGALNNAAVRRIAINLLNVERDQFKRDHPKKTITYRALRYQASLDTSFLEKVMIDNLL